MRSLSNRSNYENLMWNYKFIKDKNSWNNASKSNGIWGVSSAHFYFGKVYPKMKFYDIFK